MKPRSIASRFSPCPAIVSGAPVVGDALPVGGDVLGVPGVCCVPGVCGDPIPVGGVRWVFGLVLVAPVCAYGGRARTASPAAANTFCFQSIGHLRMGEH